MNADRITLSVVEAATALGISERFLRELIQRGEVPAMRLGRRVVLSRAVLEAWAREKSGRA